MSRLVTTLRRAVADISVLERGWALVGGLAVGARAEPRTTRDVDIAIAVATDDEAEAVVFSLRRDGYTVVTALEQTSTGRLATVRLRPPGARDGGVVVDLLFASSGIEPEVVAAAQPMELLPRLLVPVATIGHLIALKVLARDDRNRPQDWDDIQALLRTSTEDDLERAREALALIEARGYGREKELRAALERALDEASSSEDRLRPRRL